MNKIALIILFILAQKGIHAQSNSVNDSSCIGSELKEVDIFIPGAMDTIQEDGLKVKVLEAADLVNGFELKSTDGAIKIVQFQIIFYDSFDGNIYAKSSKGNRVKDDEKKIPLSKIKGATMLIVDKILIRYKDTCYKAKALIYLLR